jgi:hypothetical protein
MLQTPVQRNPSRGTRAVLNDEEYAQRMRQVKAFANIEAGNPASLVPAASAAQSLPEGNGRDTLLSRPS